MTTALQHGLAPTRTVLPNVAVVIAKRSTISPAVTISASFRAGNVCDPPDKVGLAYFLSRVIDRGTDERDAESIAEALDSRGVVLNATVTRHTFTLSCNALAEDFEPILELIADISRRPTMPEVEIATRRGEIVTSIRQDEDTPAVMAVEGLLNLLYPDGHPYGRRSKGTVGSLERIDRPGLQEFHRRYFSPSGLSLVIVGDVEIERAGEVAARVFGDWEGAAVDLPVLPPVPVPALRRELAIAMMNKAQADIAYGFPTLTRSDPAYYAFSVMNNVLGQYGLGGRLGDNIRERQGMAYYVFSAFDATVAPGPLIVRAGVNPLNVERAIEAIDTELARLAADGVTEGELADAKQYLIGSMPRTLETNAGIAAFLQAEEYFSLGLDHDLRLPGLLAAVTLDQANEVARRFLVPQRAAVVVAGPYEARKSQGAGAQAASKAHP